MKLKPWLDGISTAGGPDRMAMANQPAFGAELAPPDGDALPNDPAASSRVNKQDETEPAC